MSINKDFINILNKEIEFRNNGAIIYNQDEKTIEQIYKDYVDLIYLYELYNDEEQKLLPSNSLISGRLDYMNENIKSKIINHNFILSTIYPNIINSISPLSETQISTILKAYINSFPLFKKSETKTYNNISQNITIKYTLFDIMKQFLNDKEFQLFINKIYDKLK